jgi:hypothetical protein
MQRIFVVGRIERRRRKVEVGEKKGSSGGGKTSSTTQRVKENSKMPRAVRERGTQTFIHIFKERGKVGVNKGSRNNGVPHREKEKEWGDGSDTSRGAGRTLKPQMREESRKQNKESDHNFCGCKYHIPNEAVPTKREALDCPAYENCLKDFTEGDSMQASMPMLRSSLQQQQRNCFLRGPSYSHVMQ